MERSRCGRAGAGDIARVGRNLRINQNDPGHGIQPLKKHYKPNQWGNHCPVDIDFINTSSQFYGVSKVQHFTQGFVNGVITILMGAITKTNFKDKFQKLTVEDEAPG
jgi:hypothetical protein